MEWKKSILLKDKCAHLTELVQRMRTTATSIQREGLEEYIDIKTLNLAIQIVINLRQSGLDAIPQEGENNE